MNFGPPLVDREETLEDLGSEMTALEIEISRQRLIREKATYKLEWAVRERDRIARHLASLVRNESAA
jgi:N-formylglutamate amidohydrolase